MTGPGILRCLAYRCDIEEPACAKRYLTAQACDNGVRVRLSHCVACDVGKANAKRYPKIKQVKAGRRFNPAQRSAQGLAQYVAKGVEA